MTLQVLEFKTEYRNGKEIDWVLVAPQGESLTKTQTWHRIKDITPPDPDTMTDNERESLPYMAMTARWSIIGPKYKAWKDGHELPETGTPLAAWAGLTPAKVEALRPFGIKTVEDVAAMSDNVITRLPFPDARKLPGLARDFLAGKDKAEVADELAEARERIAAMEAMLEELTASKKEPEQAPKRRGRPPKQEQDNAA